MRQVETGPIIYMQSPEMLCIWSLNESILRWGEDEKNFQSKELFGAEEFNLAIAILNSEAPNYSEDWKFVSSFSYLDKESSMTKLIFFYIRATFHPHFLFLGTKKFSSLGAKNFLSLIFNPTGTKKIFLSPLFVPRYKKLCWFLFTLNKVQNGRED